MHLPKKVSEVHMHTARSRLLILTIAVLAAPFALALNASSSTPGEVHINERHARASATISTERITKHVSFLASDKLQGRRAGTPAADEAAAYIEKEFRSYGLKPASPSGLLQPFTFVSSVKLGDQNGFQVKTANGTRALKLGDEFMPLAFSPGDQVAGEVGFVGYGISATELQFDS